jgi:hypothetical protein
VPVLLVNVIDLVPSLVICFLISASDGWATASMEKLRKNRNKENLIAIVLKLIIWTINVNFFI